MHKQHKTPLLASHISPPCLWLEPVPWAVVHLYFVKATLYRKEEQPGQLWVDGLQLSQGSGSASSGLELAPARCPGANPSTHLPAPSFCSNRGKCISWYSLRMCPARQRDCAHHPQTACLEHSLFPGIKAKQINPPTAGRPCRAQPRLAPGLPPASTPGRSPWGGERISYFRPWPKSDPSGTSGYNPRASWWGLCWAQHHRQRRATLLSAQRANPSPGIGTWITKRCEKQFQKDRKTCNIIYAVIWQVLKPASITLFLLHASKVRGRTSLHSPRVASLFTLLVHSHLACVGPYLCACLSPGRAAAHLGSGELWQQPAWAGMALVGHVPACLTSETIFEPRCCISNYYRLFTHMHRV